jgi:MFS family permease
VRNRWGILAVLFAVRATMAFQFQSVAAIAPLLGREFGVGLADIGILIELYFAPGVVQALPGGALGQKFGDRTRVIVRCCGGMAMAFGASWSRQIAGRLVAGAGAERSTDHDADGLVRRNSGSDAESGVINTGSNRC